MRMLRTSHNLYNIYESHPQSLERYVHLSEKIQKTEEKFSPKLPFEQFFNKINSQISKNRESGENKEKIRALFWAKKEEKEEEILQVGRVPGKGRRKNGFSLLSMLLAYLRISLIPDMLRNTGVS